MARNRLDPVCVSKNARIGTRGRGPVLYILFLFLTFYILALFMHWYVFTCIDVYACVYIDVYSNHVLNLQVWRALKSTVTGCCWSGFMALWWRVRTQSKACMRGWWRFHGRTWQVSTQIVSLVCVSMLLSLRAEQSPVNVKQTSASLFFGISQLLSNTC